MEEVFKEIKGYEGAYQISNLGRVRSFLHWDRDGLDDRFLQPFNNRLGYPMVYLYTDGKPRCKKIHRLVAEAFLDNPENHPHVNHKDKDKGNYILSNLEFCTVSYNLKHSYANGRIPAWTGKKFSDEHKKKLSDMRGLSGNSRAKKAIDLSTLIIYGCGKEAAIARDIPYNTLKNELSKPKNKYKIVWLSVYETMIKEAV